MSSDGPRNTERLILREWRNEDAEAFAELNADAAVREFFPGTLSRKESDNEFKRIQDRFADQGFGLWAVEVPRVAEFIGFIGLNRPGFMAHFTPCIEIGWRLAAQHWGKGYATEGAAEILRFAFEELKLEEIVSFTTINNIRSRRVMEKLGMQRSADDDFNHPKLAADHPLRPHVLYRIASADWVDKKSSASRETEL